MKSSKLMTLLERFPGHRVAVVGDLMLDVYCWGRAVRLSPEAPVPVVEVERITSCLFFVFKRIYNFIVFAYTYIIFNFGQKFWQIFFVFLYKTSCQYNTLFSGN